MVDFVVFDMFSGATVPVRNSMSETESTGKNVIPHEF